MYTSDRNDIKKAAVYLLISLGLALFGAVYEHFSFGVYSNYMIYAFAIPLACGTLVYLVRYMAGQKAGTARGPARLLAIADGWQYHAAIATLTAGSLMHGILAICGRPNSLTIVYPVAAALLLAAALASALRQSGASHAGVRLADDAEYH